MTTQSKILRKEKKYTSAIENGEKIIKLVTSTLGKEHHKLSYFLNDLSISYFYDEQYEHALKNVRQAIEHAEKYNTSQVGFIGNMYLNCAKYHYKAAQIPDSKLCANQALNTYQRVYKKEHRKVQNAINMLNKIDNFTS